MTWDWLQRTGATRELCARLASAIDDERLAWGTRVRQASRGDYAEIATSGDGDAMTLSKDDAAAALRTLAVLGYLTPSRSRRGGYAVADPPAQHLDGGVVRSRRGGWWLRTAAVDRETWNPPPVHAVAASAKSHRVYVAEVDACERPVRGWQVASDPYDHLWRRVRAGYVTDVRALTQSVSERHGRFVGALPTLAGLAPVPSAGRLRIVWSAFREALVAVELGTRCGMVLAHVGPLDGKAFAVRVERRGPQAPRELTIACSGHRLHELAAGGSFPALERILLGAAGPAPIAPLLEPDPPARDR